MELDTLFFYPFSCKIKVYFVPNNIIIVFINKKKSYEYSKNEI